VKKTHGPLLGEIKERGAIEEGRKQKNKEVDSSSEA